MADLPSYALAHTLRQILDLLEALHRDDVQAVQQLQAALSPPHVAPLTHFREHCAAHGVVSLGVHCKYCDLSEEQHEGGKCLFGPQTYSPCPCGLHVQEYDHLRKGEYIFAIKALWAREGLGLKEAKDWVGTARATHGLGSRK